MSLAIPACADYWDALQDQQGREAERRAAFVERESELRPVDLTWIANGLRNLNEIDERRIAAALVAKDLVEAGRLIDTAAQRWIAERIQDDADDLA